MSRVTRIIDSVFNYIINNFFEVIEKFHKLLLIAVTWFISAFCYYKDLILSEDFFDSFTNIFVGASSFIIALVIFSIERSVDSKNGGLLKKTLIKESNVKNIVVLTIVAYFLLLFQLIIPLSIYVLIIRIMLLFLTIIILCKLFKGFVAILNIFIDENTKNKRMIAFLEGEAEKQNKEDKKTFEIKSSDLVTIEKNFSAEKIIKYEPYFFDRKNYITYKSDRDGVIKKLNHDSLLQINKDIKSNLLKDEDLEKTDILIITKLSGDDVRKNEPVIYIKKDTLNDSDIIDKVYTITRHNKELTNVIKARILDLSQFFVDSIINNRFLDIKVANSEIISLYIKLIEINSRHREYIYTNILEIYRRIDKLELNDDLAELLLGLADSALKLNVKDDFLKFLNLYYWTLEKNVDEEFSDTINQILFRMRLSLEYNDDIQNKQEYYEILLLIKQQMFKTLLDKDMANQIFKNNLYSSELNINELKNILMRVENFKKFPEKYININLSEEIERLLIESNIKFQEISLNASLYLGILEWFRINLQERNFEKNDMKFLENITEKFEDYNWNDVLELYLFVDRMENRISEVWNQWEFSKPANRNTIFSPTFDISKSIALLLFYVDKPFNDSLYYEDIINKENKYKFNNLKGIILNNDNLKLLDINLSFENIIELRKKIIDHIDEIIDGCEKKEKEYLITSNLPDDYDYRFKQEIINAIKENKKGTIFEFFQNLGNIQFSKKIVKTFWGYNRIEDKSFFVENFDEAVKFYAEHYSEGLLNDQSNMIIENLKDVSNKTFETIEKIIAKFRNTDEVYILSPYYINEFNYSDKGGYFYLFNNKEIPVYEVRGLYDEIIIGDKNSFGNIIYYKGDKISFKNQLADDYTVAELIDFKTEVEKMNQLIKLNPDWLKNKENPSDYLKLSCNLKLCQKVEYIRSKSDNIFIKPIE